MAGDSPARGRRARERATRQAEVIGAARQLFAGRGYQRTTMVQIAAASELALGTLYQLFASKEAILYRMREESESADRGRCAGAGPPARREAKRGDRAMSAEGPDIREPRPGVASPEVGSENGSRWTRELQAWRLPSHRRSSPARRLALSAVALAFLAVVGYVAYLWHYSTLHVSTDDAFMTGHIAPVSPRISGTAVAILANDNQDVKAGDLLVRLDPRDYEVVVAQARAAVEAARGELQNAVVSVPLTDESP